MRSSGGTMPEHVTHEIKVRNLEELPNWVLRNIPQALNYQLLTAGHHELTQKCFSIPTTSLCPMSVHARQVPRWT